MAAAMLAAIACSGYVDPQIEEPDEEVEIPEEYTEPFTLSVDKTAVEASGSDWVNFSLKDAYDRELLTDNKALSNVNIFDQNGVYLERRSVKARFIEDGERIFTATYKGKKSNTVTVVAQNRAKYEKFHKNVAIYKMTGTGCPYCPSMTSAIGGLDEEAKAHSVNMNWHGGSSWDDPYALFFSGSTYDCASMILSIFADRTDMTLGFPTVVLDLAEVVTQRSSSVLSSAIWNLRADYPATCGIKLSSEYNATTGMVDVAAELTSSAGGQYDLGICLLLDGEYFPNGTEENGQYNKIVIANTGNYYTYFSDRIATVAKDASKSYKFSLGNSSISIASKKDKISVVAYALVKGEGGVARIDNVVKAPLGKAIDYQLN